MKKTTAKICLGKILCASGINQVVKNANAQRTKILLYHAIVKDNEYMPELDFADLCIPKTAFEKNIIYLKNNFDIISLDEFLSGGGAGKSRGPNVIITFDDGYLNNFTEAYPILKRHNVKATFFISSLFVGSSDLLWFNNIEWLVYHARKDVIKPFTALPYLLYMRSRQDRIKAVKLIKGRIQLLPYLRFKNAIEELHAQMESGVPVPERYCFKPMSWEHVKEMADNPLITIGSHGKSHHPLSNMEERFVREELEGSKRFIEQQTGKRVRHFSYPHGFYNNGAATSAKVCGYDTALTTIHGFNDKDVDYYHLRRNEIGNSGERAIFTSIACGGWDFMKGLFKKGVN